MFTKILVGYDGSPHAKRALEVALDLAKRYNAEITAVSVTHVSNFEANDALGEAKKLFTRLLQEAQERAARESVAIRVRIVSGYPPDTLVHLAEAEKYELIVVGARSLSGIKRYLKVSVSEATVRHSPCPVLVVK